ncbi:MAG: efflux RND transporter periplasmic adaptor subunit, partial [Myxococcota bacterium]
MGLAALGAQGCDKEEANAGARVRADQEARASGHAQDAEYPMTPWCKGHGIPESMCTRCHPELVDEFKDNGDWCAEHGFPESACPVCNPMDPPGQQQAADAEYPMTPWCKGHGIPESMCTRCHPELVDEFK